MPDISMCHGVVGKSGLCPIRDNCFRFRAIPDHLQAYFMLLPEGDCDFFIPSRPGDKLRPSEVINEGL